MDETAWSVLGALLGYAIVLLYHEFKFQTEVRRMRASADSARDIAIADADRTMSNIVSIRMRSRAD